MGRECLCLHVGGRGKRRYRREIACFTADACTKSPTGGSSYTLIARKEICDFAGNRNTVLYCTSHAEVRS